MVCTDDILSAAKAVLDAYPDNTYLPPLDESDQYHRAQRLFFLSTTSGKIYYDLYSAFLQSLRDDEPNLSTWRIALVARIRMWYDNKLILARAALKSHESWIKPMHCISKREVEVTMKLLHSIEEDWDCTTHDDIIYAMQNSIDAYTEYLTGIRISENQIAMDRSISSRQLLDSTVIDEDRFTWAYVHMSLDALIDKVIIMDDSDYSIDIAESELDYIQSLADGVQAREYGVFSHENEDQTENVLIKVNSKTDMYKKPTTSPLYHQRSYSNLI